MVGKMATITKGKQSEGKRREGKGKIKGKAYRKNVIGS